MIGAEKDQCEFQYGLILDPLEHGSIWVILGSYRRMCPIRAWIMQVTGDDMGPHGPWSRVGPFGPMLARAGPTKVGATRLAI